MSARPIAIIGGSRDQNVPYTLLPPPSLSANATVQAIIAKRNAIAMMSLFLVVAEFLLINDCLPKKEWLGFYQPGKKCHAPGKSYQGFSGGSAGMYCICIVYQNTPLINYQSFSKFYKFCVIQHKEHVNAVSDQAMVFKTLSRLFSA